MKTIEQIYTEYRIMPALQTHQLRVAAVAKMVCETTLHIKKPLVTAH